MDSVTSGRVKWLVAAAALFAFCVAPTFISYQPYLFTWDDADYLQRAVAVSRAFWSGDVHGLSAVISSKPVMPLLGLPWGSLASWDAAGNCFVTLAAVISLLAASCLYLLLRLGVNPWFLVVASVCVGASLGPYPPGVHSAFDAHTIATGFMTDSLLAWTALAAVLLIPYEVRTPCPSIRSAVLRGILCASILSLGVMTKVSFLYFIGLIVPIVFFTRLHHGGRRSAFAWLLAFVCWSAPAAVYWVRYGRSAFAQARASTFGGTADFYYVPPLQFLARTIRGSPGLGLSLVLMVAALVYLVIKRRLVQSWPEFAAFLMILGYGILALASANKQIRYAFPAIVALPFLLAILLSRQPDRTPAPSHALAALAAGLALLGLVAAGVPTRHRADRQSISRADAVLAQSVRCNAKSILLATDSPTLNFFLLNLALEFSPSGASTGTLAYQVMTGVPIEEDFRALSESDMVVFQDARRINPRFTNQRVAEYERYIRQGGSVPIRVGDDVSVYAMRCRP
jgi:hypothetical protein